MSSPYLQRPSRSLSQARTEAERRAREFGDRRELLSAEYGDMASGSEYRVSDPIE